MDGKKLDRKVDLQRKTVTQDEFGGEVAIWSSIVVGGVWANYAPVSDGEKLSAGEVSSTLSARFTVRYDSAWSDVSALDRLVFEGKTFDIWGAKETADGRRRFIEITAAARSE